LAWRLTETLENTSLADIMPQDVGVLGDRDILENSPVPRPEP